MQSPSRPALSVVAKSSLPQGGEQPAAPSAAEKSQGYAHNVPHPLLVHSSPPTTQLFHAFPEHQRDASIASPPSQGAPSKRSPLQPPLSMFPKATSITGSPQGVMGAYGAQMFKIPSPTFKHPYGASAGHSPVRSKKRQRSQSPTQLPPAAASPERPAPDLMEEDNPSPDGADFADFDALKREVLDKRHFVSPPLNPALSGLNLHHGSRSAASLVVLTKKFIQLIEKTPNGELDLNQAAVKLCVQKRRVYDIVNVLEGVDVISKTSKNRIQWKRHPQPSEDIPAELIEEHTQLSQEIQELEREEAQLELKLEAMGTRLHNLIGPNQEQMHLSHADIKELFDDGSTVISVKAPVNATCEILTPEEGTSKEHSKYQVFMQSPSGSMQVVLLRPTTGLNLVKTVH